MKKDGLWRWYLRSFRPWIPALILLVLCHVAIACLGVGFALGSQEVIDTAVNGAKTGEHQPFVYACIKQATLILSIIVINAVSHLIHEQLMAVMDRDWKHNLLHRLLRGEFAAVSKYHTGELLNLMNNDVRIMITSVLNLLPSIATMSTKLIAALSVLIAMEPKLTYVVVIAGVTVVIVTGFIRRKLKSLNKQVSKAQGKVSGFIQETLEKLLMVQAMDISDVIDDRADVLLLERYKLQKKRKNISVLSRLCMSILAYGSSFGALAFCANGILQGTMSFGTLTAITQLVSQIRGPFTSMSGIGPQYAAMCAAAERLKELEDQCSYEEIQRKDTRRIYEQATCIEARELTFAYDRDYVFDHASFTLPKGSFGVITGHSGIGKSTLLKLLLGIFPPQSGSLSIVTEEDHIPTDRTVRRLFAYVPQGNLLLSGTLRDNLLVTNKDATQEEIDRAIYISAMDAYLPTLPEGLDTVVGENALGLSEGQAQRLSIARAILSNAPILLLDEATSALDDETEKQVLQRIRELPGKTCIAVTHRSAATEVADWALEMHEGKCTVKFKNPT